MPTNLPHLRSFAGRMAQDGRPVLLWQQKRHPKGDGAEHLCKRHERACVESGSTFHRVRLSSDEPNCGDPLRCCPPPTNLTPLALLFCRRVEQAFFQRFYSDADEKMRGLTRSMAASGQLEFINGGERVADKGGTKPKPTP